MSTPVAHGLLRIVLDRPLHRHTEARMNRTIRTHRWITVTVLAAVLLAGLSSAAGAHSGKRRGRGDQVRVIHRDDRPASTYIVRRSSGAGPAIAGFLGGLFLGAALAHAAPAGYVYEDPYCGHRFHSLEVYHAHFVRHRHPGVIHVVALDHGDYVHSYRYTSGRWRAWDDHGYAPRRGHWCDEHRAWERERHFERRERDWEDDR
jgi:hypothetical protein